MENQLNYHPLPKRQRVGFYPEDSHLYPHLTEPGLVSPLDKILKAQQQGLPVQFNAGKYLDQDFSVLDNLDSFELFEYRQNLTMEIEERKREFHAATKLLAQKEKEDAESVNSSSSDADPQKTVKVDSKASKEADSSHNPS